MTLQKQFPNLLSIPRKFTECSTFYYYNMSRSSKICLEIYSSLCVETQPCYVRQVQHVKDVMKYVPITQSKVCKQSITARWHLLPPNSSQPHSVFHSLSVCLTWLLLITSLPACVPLILQNTEEQRFTRAAPSSLSHCLLL